ncbi:hypothetical protein A3K63_04070 [Candidatus Micrarchaeota archaeon RBG_16_49_10]|nr:MAG: hypothetical protein A3K63_04070 [Candidatus Micrarchaeota archaeon RBG_16_49_10]
MKLSVIQIICVIHVLIIKQNNFSAQELQMVNIKKFRRIQMINVLMQYATTFQKPAKNRASINIAKLQVIALREHQWYYHLQKFQNRPTLLYKTANTES